MIREGIARALLFMRRAGEQALDSGEYEQAAQYFERALTLLDRADSTGDARAELLLLLARATLRAGEVERTWQAVCDAAAEARRLSSVALLAQAALTMQRSSDAAEVNRGRMELLEEALAALGASDSALRARVQADLGRVLSLSGVWVRGDALSRSAISLARRLDDPPTLAFTLASRCHALAASCQDEDRLSLSAELLDLAQRNGDRELAMEAHRWRVADAVAFGDLPAVDDEIRTARPISEPLHQPYYLWWCGVWRSMRATLVGDFETGKHLATEAHAIGTQTRSRTARIVLTVQTIVRLWQQGEVKRVASLVDGFVAEHGETYPESQLGRPWALAGAGRSGDASREIEALAVAEYRGVPVTQTSLIAGAVIAETFALLGDAANAVPLYERLHPYAVRVVVLGPAIACLGPMDRFLGLLAALAHEWDTAEAHFARSLERSRDLAALPFVARTQLNHAAMLCARGRADDRGRAATLLAEAFTGAHRLGMVQVAQDIRHAQARLAATIPAQIAVPAMPAETNSLTRAGDHWTFLYRGSVCRIRARAGVRYLAMLLERPHQEVAALQLIAAERTDTADTAEPPRNTGGPEGVGVRARRTGSPAERARVRVSRALRDAITRIRAADARLGKHLARSVRTGTFCCYAPGEETVWTVARG